MCAWLEFTERDAEAVTAPDLFCSSSITGDPRRLKERSEELVSL